MESESICEKLISKSDIDFKSYSNLPLSVYIKCADGTILNFNKEAAELLELNDSQKGKINIGTFYPVSKERDLIKKKLSENVDGGWTKNEILNYIVNNKKIVLRYFAKTYKDDNNVFLGTLCIAFQISEFSKFETLDDDMIPFGLFEVSENNKISYSNKKFKEILKIDSEEEVLATDFFGEPEMYSEMFLELKKGDGTIKNKKIELTKHDKEEFIGNLNVKAYQKDNEEQIIKALGIIEDVTFNDVLNDFPSGLFRLHEVKGNLKVEYCNDHFAEIFDKTIDQCKETTFEILINRDETYKRLRESLIQLNPNDKPIKLHFLSVNVGNNIKELFFQIRLLDKKSKKYGGAIYDVTGEIESKLFSVKQDLAAFFHTSASVRVSIRSTIHSIIAANGTVPVHEDSTMDIDLVYSNILGHIKGFQTFFKRFQQIILTKVEFDNIVVDDIELYLLRLSKKLDRDDLSKVKIAFIRNTFLRIRERIFENSNLINNISNEITRGLKNEIEGIFRYARLLSLQYCENEMVVEQAEMEELKSALSYGSYTPQMKRFNLLHPLKEAIQGLNELADLKKIDIKLYTPNHVNIPVLGDERNLYYAFYNVLNNAIKYTWFTKLEVGKYRVNIELIEDESEITVIIENKGVGMEQKEIDSGILFEFGNRGSKSSDAKRHGHGVGLWHTKKIINEFNGTININSKPEQSFYVNNMLRERFVTQVIIKIPKHR